jgi:hypothetical protein
MMAVLDRDLRGSCGLRCCIYVEPAAGPCIVPAGTVRVLPLAAIYIAVGNELLGERERLRHAF